MSVSGLSLDDACLRRHRAEGLFAGSARTTALIGLTRQVHPRIVSDLLGITTASASAWSRLAGVSGPTIQRCVPPASERESPVRARAGGRFAQLLNGRRPGEPLRSAEHPAGEPDEGEIIGEGVDAVDEDGRGPVKSEALGFLGGLYSLTCDSDIGSAVDYLRESLVEHLPVGAAVEVLQRDPHAGPLSSRSRGSSEALRRSRR